MRKVFGLKKASPLGILTAEYIFMGVLISLFSVFLGFYTAAFILADKCYPELTLKTINLVHGQIFHSLPLAAAGYSLLIFIFYWFFARSQVKSIARIVRTERRD